MLVRDTIFALEEVVYSSDNIGDDLVVTINLADRASPIVDAGGTRRRLRHGETWTGSIALLQLGAADQDKPVPLCIDVREVDTRRELDDVARVDRMLTLDTSADASRFDVTVPIEARGDDRPRRADLLFRIAARPARVFTIGRDNIAFTNPNGAVGVGALRGNCYAMAAMSKLLFETADYDVVKPHPAGAALDLAACGRILKANKGRIEIAGVADLFKLTGVAMGDATQDWVLADLRAALGLAAVAGAAPPPAPGPLPPATRADLVAGYTLVTLFFYLRYARDQFADIVGPIAADAADQLGGRPRAARIASAKRAIEATKAAFAKGETALVCYFAPKEPMGHVVLAYQPRQPRPGLSAGVVAVDVYDNELTQKADDCWIEIDPATGDAEIFVSGQSNPGPNWAKTELVLFPLDDPMRDPARRAEFGAVLERHQAWSVLIVGAGDLVRRTGRDPAKFSLFDDVAESIGSLAQASASIDKQGHKPIVAVPALAAPPTFAGVNAWLAANTLPLLRTLLATKADNPPPLALSFVDPARPNRARAEINLDVGGDESVDAVVKAIEGHVWFGADPRIASVLGYFRRQVLGEGVKAMVLVDLEKRAATIPIEFKLGNFGVFPAIAGAHLTVGAIKPGAFDPKKAMFKLEFAEKTIKEAGKRALKAVGAFDPIKLTYAEPNTGLEIKTSVSFKDIDIRLQKARIAFLINATATIKTPIKTIEVVTKPDIGLFISLTKTIGKNAGKNIFTMSVKIIGWVGTNSFAEKAAVGVLIVAIELYFKKSLTSLAVQLTKTGSGQVQTALTTELSKILTPVQGSTVEIDLDSLKIEDQSNYQDLDAGPKLRVAVAFKPVDIDLTPTLTNLFGNVGATLEIRDLIIEDGRLIVEANP